MNQCNSTQLQFYSLAELDQLNHLLFIIYLSLFDNLLLLNHSLIIGHITILPAYITIYLSRFDALADQTYPYSDLLLHFLIVIQSIQ